MPDEIRAPWTPEQIDALNTYQANADRPMICGRSGRDHGGIRMAMIARPDGWHCSDPGCDYRQHWALDYMAQLPSLDAVSARFAGLRRAMAAPLPTPEEIAAGNAADRAEAERLHRLRPGVPLHHVYAVLQAKREADRYDAAKRAPADEGVAPLLWAETVTGYPAEGRIGVPATDADGNIVGEMSLDRDNAEVLADMLLHILDEDDTEEVELP